MQSTQLTSIVVAVLLVAGCASPGYNSNTSNHVPVICTLGEPHSSDGNDYQAAYECVQTRGPGLVVLDGCLPSAAYVKNDGTVVSSHYRCDRNMSGLYPAGPGIWVDEDKVRVVEEAERRRAENLAAAQQRAAETRAARAKSLAEIKLRGPVPAYPALAIERYTHCQELADTFLSVEEVRSDNPSLKDLRMEAIRECVSAEESALSDDVRAALAHASLKVADPIKELHAYTVASLRALINFHQSPIEARQARSARMAGVDERATRLELDLN